MPSDKCRRCLWRVTQPARRKAKRKPAYSAQCCVFLTSMQVETNVSSHEVSPWRAKKRQAISAPSIESAAKSVAKSALTDTDEPDRSGNPSSPRQRPPVCFVGNKYILLDKVDGNSLFMCVDMQTRQELVCKVGHVTSLDGQSATLAYGNS